MEWRLGMERRTYSERTLKQGAYYHLTLDVNAIPAGVYKLEDYDESSLFFIAGKRIPFFITRDVLPWLELVPPSRACLLKTSAKQFTDRYYTLLEELRTHKTVEHGPITGCFMPVDFAYEVN
jgi:hypothetical protein